MTQQEKPDTKQLIERTNHTFLKIISQICLIMTLDESDESDRLEALRLAKHQNAEIEKWLLEENAG
ncbi:MULTISPECIES: hypothetical protein [unclassified Xenorhabdus]|uniref:hypothetical protein n=1 Tax=Xenorhabdus TaxID=626 RepID=UPI000C055DCF|nr:MULTISPECIES: hypothetical protein [unclassified Xenorhabdus]MCC8378657.1 hypothetical protein [Xenorhabdus sp. PB30.3]PHM52511.1 hypothetical protein Xekk_03188 [Xenorhabdus sp. KK7.4]